MCSHSTHRCAGVLLVPSSIPDRFLVRHQLLFSGSLAEWVSRTGYVAYIPTLYLYGLHLPGKLGIKLTLKDLEDLIHSLLQAIHAPPQLTSCFVIIPNNNLFDEAVDLPPLLLESTRPIVLALGVEALKDLIKLKSHQLL
jgi:hypothetical protein